MTGLFGGAFDPIHDAHLTVAREARDRIGLDRIVFIPSGIPPHKSLRAPFEHRLAMVRLACEEFGFEVSDCEGGSERSYTFDTLQHFPAPRAFIIGADAFSEVETWYRWRDVLKMTEFIVVSRPGHNYDIPAGAKVRRLETLALPVSSSEIRAALARGERPADLPETVFRYIRQHKLYGFQEETACSRF